MTISIFVGTSVDGFIARPNGDLDFLPPGGGEPHGYNEFIATVDAIVIGRKTFETVLAMEDWPYADKRVVVLSSRPVDLSGAGGVVEQMGGPPADIVSQLWCQWCPQPLHRRWDHDSRVPAGEADSTTCYHSRAGAHWRRSSSLRHTAARHSAPSHSHSALPQRSGSKRVPGCRLVVACGFRSVDCAQSTR